MTSSQPGPTWQEILAGALGGITGVLGTLTGPGAPPQAPAPPPSPFAALGAYMPILVAGGVVVAVLALRK